MRAFYRLFRAERIKLRRSRIWLLVLISPLLAGLFEFLVLQTGEGEKEWLNVVTEMSYFHALLFLPLLAGIFSATVCRAEHDSGGWKQLLALPVQRSAVYLAKLFTVALLLLLTQLAFLGMMIVVGVVNGMGDTLPWDMILRSTASGWLATLPLAALQMAVSVGWASFAAPLSINVILTLPNILVVNSAEYGPYYPWAQPFIAMLPRSGDSSFGALTLPLETLLYVIIGGFLIFLAGGLTYFKRKEM